LHILVAIQLLELLIIKLLNTLDGSIGAGIANDKILLLSLQHYTIHRIRSRFLKLKQKAMDTKTITEVREVMMKRNILNFAYKKFKV